MTDPVAEFIRAEPAAVAATIAAADAFLATWAPPPGGLVLVGSGSSSNPLLVGAPASAAAGRGPVALRTPLAFLAEVDALARWAGGVVVLSQSGASRTSIDAAAAALARRLPTLIVTGDARSAIAGLDAPTLVMPIGDEPIGPKTKGYGASVAAMLALAHRLGGAPSAPADIEHALAAAVAQTQAPAEALAARLDRVDFILVCGEGRHLGIAIEGALKISEIAGLPAAGADTEEALHGRFHSLTGRSLALFLAGSPAESAAADRAISVLAALGVPAHRIGAADFAALPALPAPWDALAAVVPLQWLARALALRRGMAPEAMRYPGLSQRLAIKVDAQP